MHAAAAAAAVQEQQLSRCNCSCCGLQFQLFQRLPDSLEVQLELQSKLLLQRLLDSLEVQLKLQLQLSESAAVQLLHLADVDQLQPLSLVLMTAFLCLIES